MNREEYFRQVTSRLSWEYHPSDEVMFIEDRYEDDTPVEETVQIIYNN